MHYPARVGKLRLRTANYSQEARERLADAVTSARESAGYKWRTTFAEAAGISVRSLAEIEQAKAGVGQSALHAVARALPGWTEDTPRLILEGGGPPEVDTNVSKGGEYGELFTADDVGTDEWIEFYAEFPEVVKAGIAVRRKRRELEMAEKLVEKYLAERPVPHEVGDNRR